MSADVTAIQDRRGPLRPASLASSRARLEARATQLLFRVLEIAAVLLLAAAFAASLPRGLLLAPVVDVLPFAAGAAVLVTCLRWAHAAEGGGSLGRSLARLVSRVMVGGVPVALLVAVLPVGADIAGRVALWFAASTVVVGGLHALWWQRRAALRRTGNLTPNIVVVGATANAERLIARARETGEVAVLGVFDDRAGRIPDAVCGVPVLGNTDALLVHRIMPSVDRVVIAVPSGAQERVRALIARLRLLPNELSLMLDEDAPIAPALSELAEMPLARVSGHRLEEAGVLAKRLQDLVLGSLALLAAAPVMLAIAAAVKLDSPGPVFFRQRRHGFHNEVITVWKFRSMHHAAADPTASQQVRGGDPRVTRVGRFIRNTSLDELPQLFNVLRGDMSLVGPRPHAVGMLTEGMESARLVAEYAHRHRMKPGVTSWAAIHGSRGPVATAEAVRRRVALDVEYIERQSLWLDLYILVKTLPCLLGDRAAVR
jgi:Undecaprenyl-phosphate glucose phosphotransferase